MAQQTTANRVGLILQRITTSYDGEWNKYSLAVLKPAIINAMDQYYLNEEDRIPFPEELKQLLPSYYTNTSTVHNEWAGFMELIVLEDRMTEDRWDNLAIHLQRLCKEFAPPTIPSAQQPQQARTTTYREREGSVAPSMTSISSKMSVQSNTDSDIFQGSAVQHGQARIPFQGTKMFDSKGCLVRS